MGITQLPPPARPSPGRAAPLVSGGAYAVVFLLGLVEGVLGSFQYSRGVVGSVPLAAIGFCLLILASCGLAGWAMQGMGAALLTAIGWFVASFGLAMPDTGGSVIIANTSPGEWYLYGGSVCALLGVGSAFVTIPRRSLRLTAPASPGTAGAPPGPAAPAAAPPGPAAPAAAPPGTTTTPPGPAAAPPNAAGAVEHPETQATEASKPDGNGPQA